MTTTTIQGISLIAMVIAMPILAWGATSDIPSMMIAGAVSFGLGLFTLTAVRYVPTKEES